MYEVTVKNRLVEAVRKAFDALPADQEFATIDVQTVREAIQSEGRVGDSHRKFQEDFFLAVIELVKEGVLESYFTHYHKADPEFDDNDNLYTYFILERP